MSPSARWQEETRVCSVTSATAFQQALMICGNSFFDGALLGVSNLASSNNFQATHFLPLVDGKPIGSARVRWFKDFARFERSCLLPNYRDPRSIVAIARQVFDLISRKGYDRFTTFAWTIGR